MIHDDSFMSPEAAAIVSKFVRGSLVTAAELVQTKRDLRRSKYAEAFKASKRRTKNYRLQSGGFLTVEQAREMVTKREIDEEAHARRVLANVEKKRDAGVQRWFQATIKTSR